MKVATFMFANYYARSTSVRSRVRRKIDEVVNTIIEEADALLNPHRKEPMPFVRGNDTNER